MSGDGYMDTKFKLLELFSELEETELDSIEQWISSKSYKNDLIEKKSLLNTEKILVKIGNTIKKIVPFDAEMPSETIVPPTVGDQADCTEMNTCHVDEFLYDEEEVEKLVRMDKLKRHYCLDCNSRNVTDLTFISHSMSREMLQYIFKVLLPEDLHDKQVLDVGSRLGAVLYGAYYFSNAGTIYGIEMNKECCDVQEKIINEFSMDHNRIKVMHADVIDSSDIVARSNVIVINVLEFFVDIETHRKIWYFLKKHIKKGSYLVCNRSMAETFKSIGLFEELIAWLQVCKPCQQNNEIYFDIENCIDIHLYVVN